MVTINIYQGDASKQSTDTVQTPVSSSLNSSLKAGTATDAPSPTMQPDRAVTEAQGSDAPPMPTLQPQGTTFATQATDAPSPTMQPDGAVTEAQGSDAPPMPTLQPQGTTFATQATDAPSPTTQPDGAVTEAQGSDAPPMPTLQPDENTGEFQASEQSNETGPSLPEPFGKPPGENPDDINTAGQTKGAKKR